MAESIQLILTTSRFELERMGKLLNSKGSKLEDGKLGVGIGFDVKSGESSGKLEIYPTNLTIHLVFDDTRVELSGMETFSFTEDQELVFQGGKGRERYLVIGKTGEVTFLRGASGGAQENGLPVPIISPRTFPSQTVTRPLQ